MERIHFNNLYKNKLLRLSIFLSFLFLITGGLKLIHFGNPKINDYLVLSGLIFLTLNNSIILGLFYKNSVNWNNKGMNIRIKSLFGVDIGFKTTTKSELLGDELVIYEKNVEKRINLSKINQTDRQRLNDLINEYAQES